ncbi:Gfo/Idh/MocA family protein [Paenibacillus athensensis]|uniref:Dehydrogenase n=1 Tax=Paenibacillus athensensis TaxID=1967502 RepID=A0A4Y8PYX9_9BACL|nr:Gfo/Idh/MocA family oxidoreductase [Paenibacillus athensensis]
MDRIRIGLIGLGDIAQKVYLPLLAAEERVDLAGLMSRSAATVERLQAKYRIPVGTTRLEELLALGLDAVFLHSPTPTHFELASRCLEAGVDVYVDKPLSNEWKESVELAALAERKGRLLAVGFNRRFAPLYGEAREWLREAGGFDWCAVVKHRVKQQSTTAKTTLYDDLIHMLDLLQWLSEAPCELRAADVRADREGRLLHASGSVAMGAANGSFSMARLSGVDLEKLELHGGGRAVEVTNLESAVFYEKDRAPRIRTFGNWDTVLQRRGFAGIVDHVLSCLGRPEQCSVRADLVLESHRLVERLCP